MRIKPQSSSANIGVLVLSFILLTCALCFLSNYFIGISEKNDDVDINSIRNELLNTNVQTRSSAEALVYKMETKYDGFSATIETDKQKLNFNVRYKNKNFKVERLFN